MVDIEQMIINYVGEPSETCNSTTAMSFCPNPLRLGFFSWVNVIVVILILIVVYSLFLTKKKRKE